MSVKFDLSGETAIVTGAAGGIGTGVAELLVASGARVILADRDHGAVQSTAAKLGCSGMQVDVTSEDSVRALIESSVAELGSISVLVNCAGLLTSALLTDLPAEDWDRVMAVNTRGVYLCSKYAAQHMKQRGRGNIVNLSSASGRQGDAGYSHYSASKFAVIGFSQAIAAELADSGIRVNSICPGLVDTQMLDDVIRAEATELSALTERDQLIHEPQRPYDIALAVAFFISSPAITGQALNVDGGFRFN